jgi:DNA-binding NarL/FixJ family response regulator
VSIAVLIVDDHRVILDGLRLLLEAKGDIKVVGEAVNGRDAVQKAKELNVDIVVMDIAMPLVNGIEATSQIRKALPTTQVIILSMHSTKEYVTRAIKAGARGYLLKESTGMELVQAVRAVMAGQRYLSQKIADILIDDYVDHADESATGTPLEYLSPREREIFQMVLEGKTSAEIANVICLSPKTVETYRSRLMQKLGVKSLPGLIKYAIQKGLIAL